VCVSMVDEAGHSGFGQGRGGNEGMSGEALWKIKQRMPNDEQREKIMQEILAARQKETPADAPHVLVDAVSVGGPTEKTQKPLVRHVVIKDLNKVAVAKHVQFPTSGMFENKAPIGLYAIFDGRSCASTAGSTVAEFCVRNFHSKVLANLAMLRQESASEPFVKATLIKSFEELDTDLLAQHPDVMEGCGAAVALLVGERVFIAMLGNCSAVLGSVEEGRVQPTLFVDSTANPAHPDERRRLLNIRAVIVTEGDASFVKSPSGALSSVTRSLGDPSWKDRGYGLVTCTPEVQCVKLKGTDLHPFLFLADSSITSSLTAERIVSLAGEFQMQPRLACGEIVSEASEALARGSTRSQCVAVGVYFLPTLVKKATPPPEGGGRPGSEPAQPAAKKPKVNPTEGTRSVRLRHILVRHRDEAAVQPSSKQAAGKQATRTRQEAESILRGAYRALRKDLADSGKSPRNPTELVMLQGKKFAELCREFSECPSAKNGGAMCGDLGWMSPEAMRNLGGNFRENVEHLKAGQWSDVTSSNSGVHLVQRIA